MPRELNEEKNGEEEKEEVKEDPVEEEELGLVKEDEEEKGMGTEEERNKEKDKQEKKVEEVRVSKWRKVKEVKQGTKEVKLNHWGFPKIMVPLPFPQRFMKKKLDKKFAKFLEVFKKLYVNIPF
ncbi:hypothetical protein ACS0TY_033891 [Phlomoides rotata]